MQIVEQRFKILWFFVKISAENLSRSEYFVRHEYTLTLYEYKIIRRFMLLRIKNKDNEDQMKNDET